MRDRCDRDLMPIPDGWNVAVRWMSPGNYPLGAKVLLTQRVVVQQLRSETTKSQGSLPVTVHSWDKGLRNPAFLGWKKDPRSVCAGFFIFVSVATSSPIVDGTCFVTGSKS